MSDLIETDVLVLGCGIAGCTAALTLADAGVQVTVATRARAPEETNTYFAQGGIIYQGLEDSAAQLIQDVMQAGAGHSYGPAVQLLAMEGPTAVERVLLERVGVPFDRTATGELSLVREGGHSLARIIHATDATGRAIQLALLNALREHPNVTLLTGHTAVDLLTPAHHSLNRLAVYEPQACVGAYLFDGGPARVLRCLAKKTIVATGGLGQIFLRSTNPPGARGDGLAMAYRMNVRIINAEFVQFHPTAFYQEQGPCFLISEAVRGAGARLVNAAGQPFMQRYDREWKDLAPRDVVARSIHREMLLNDTPNVFLDLCSYLERETILSHFPTIYAQCLQNGVDITEELAPVVPAAHYFCGGIWVDEWGQTDHQHLYAVGEVACTGVHGANRLASNSLLEGLVFGARAARAMTEPPSAGRFPGGLREADGDCRAGTPRDSGQPLGADELRRLAWEAVGVERDGDGLRRAVDRMAAGEAAVDRIDPAGRTLADWRLASLLTVGRLMATAALRRTESRGGHYRSDFPARDDVHWSAHIAERRRD